MSKKLIYLGFSEEEKRILTELCKDFEIKARELKKEDYNEKIGYLLGIDNFKHNEDINKNDFSQIQFALFSDFDRDYMKRFLLELKERGLVISHKAVQTQKNIDWTLSYLLKHIEDERRLLIKFKNLGILVKKAQNLIEEDESKKDLKILLDRAYSLQNQVIDEKKLDKIREELSKYLQKFNR